MKNSGDSVFSGLHIGPKELALWVAFVDGHDFAANTRRAFSQDVRKFARWFSTANKEPFTVGRVTTRDVADFRDNQRRDGQAVSTVNRSLTTMRRFFRWLTANGHVPSNPTVVVKELRRQQLAPKGLDRSEVRKLLREVELRSDVRARAILCVFLYCGCRVGDLVGLEMGDLMLSDRAGTAVFRNGKGRKQRTVPVPLPARRALQEYLETRPPIDSPKVFAGERGPLTDRGVRALCDKYAAICGMKLHPHLLRHTMAHQWLADGGDLSSLAQVLGHSSISITSRYVLQNLDSLSAGAERLNY